MKKRKSKKKKFSLKKQYKLSWNFLKESRNFISLAFGVFLVFVLIGYFFPVPVELQEMIKNYIQAIVLETEGMGTFELISFIFLNNLQVSFIGLLFGVVLGILPIFYSIANGYLLGFVLKLAFEEQGLCVFLDLIPHGIFELPAVFISLALGLKLGSFAFEKNKQESLRNFFLNSMRVFVLIVVPLLIVAAIIEGLLIVF
jgi:stage II sporulation protein M